MPRLIDNINRNIDIIEETKVETIIQLWELGYIQKDQIREVLCKLFFTNSQIDYWLKEYSV